MHTFKYYTEANIKQMPICLNDLQIKNLDIRVENILQMTHIISNNNTLSNDTNRTINHE